MKLTDIIVIFLTGLVLFEGLEGEFSNPTPFDFIKWICYLIMIGAYIYNRKRGDE